MKSKTEDRAALMALGLNPDAPALDVVPTRSQPEAATVVLAPEGVDPHTMPGSDIVFDPALLDGFPTLKGAEYGAASRHVWEFYKSRRGDTDRNRRLHDEIGLFINRVRRSRETGTQHVKEQIRAGKKQRDLLALLAEHGINSVDDLKNTLGGA